MVTWNRSWEPKNDPLSTLNKDKKIFLPWLSLHLSVKWLYKHIPATNKVETELNWSYWESGSRLRQSAANSTRICSSWADSATSAVINTSWYPLSIILIPHTFREDRSGHSIACLEGLTWCVHTKHAAGGWRRGSIAVILLQVTLSCRVPSHPQNLHSIPDAINRVIQQTLISNSFSIFKDFITLGLFFYAV